MSAPSKKRLAYSLVLLLFLSVPELLRIMHYSVTWDEGLTYVKHVERIFYPEDFSRLISYFRNIPNAGNNHLMNTLLIGIFTRLTGLRYNVFILRLPVLLFFALYILFVLREFLNRRISWLGCSLLLCCPYLNEFFSLARGYAISATLVFLTMRRFRRWLTENKDSDLLLTAGLLLLAEAANTAALLVSGPLCLLIIIRLIRRRDIPGVLHRAGVPAVLFAISQALVLLYHLYVSHIDLLYANRSGTPMKLLRDYVVLPACRRDPRFTAILLTAIAALALWNILLLYQGKSALRDYPATLAFLLHIMLCTLAAEITKGGYPGGRVLLIAYPVFALSLEELTGPLLRLIDKRSGTAACSGILQAAICAILLLSLLFHTDMGKTTDWPDADKYRDMSYAVYETARPVDRDYFGQNLDPFRYWRGQILCEHGFDIFEGIDDPSVPGSHVK